MLELMLRGRVASYDGEWSVYVKNLTTQESLVINDEPMKSAKRDEAVYHGGCL